MSFQDPISDCLTRIRNGLMRGKSNVFVPYSKLKHELVNVLVAEGYLKGCVKTDDSVSEKPMINVELKYHNEEPVIKDEEPILVEDDLQIEQQINYDYNEDDMFIANEEPILKIEGNNEREGGQ